MSDEIIAEATTVEIIAEATTIEIPERTTFDIINKVFSCNKIDSQKWCQKRSSPHASTTDKFLLHFLIIICLYVLAYLNNHIISHNTHFYNFDVVQTLLNFINYYIIYVNLQFYYLNTLHTSPQHSILLRIFSLNRFFIVFPIFIHINDQS